MQNAECRMQNAECRMQNAECRMQNAECRMQKMVQGFSLIEAVLALAVVAIIATFAIPAYQNSVTDTKIKVMTEELVTMINLAKSSALNTGKSVALCGHDPADDSKCSNETDWSDGAKLATVDIIHEEIYVEEVHNGWIFSGPPATAFTEDADPKS